MRKGWWLGLALLLVSPAFAEPAAGKIPAPPVPGQMLPPDAQVQLTLNGRDYVYSGAELRFMTGAQPRADRTILLGMLQGLMEEKKQKAAAAVPEFTPVLDFTPRASQPVGPVEPGGPPEPNAVAPGQLGSL